MTEPVQPQARMETLVVDDTGLHTLQVRPTLSDYFSQLWSRRHFIFIEARSKALADGRDMFLGNFWIFLNPLFQVFVYAVVFGILLKTSRGIDNFIGFLVIGVIFFGFISKGITSSSGLILGQKNMISSFRFPKASLVISANLRHLIDNVSAALVAVGIAILFQLDKPFHWQIIWVIPIFLLVHLFNTGVGFFVARATAFVPDLKSIVALVVRALFFISGIFFSIDRFDSEPLLREIMQLNPIYQFLTMVRLCVLDGLTPPVSMWLYVSGWSFMLLALGLVYFWRAEERYARVK